MHSRHNLAILSSAPTGPTHECAHFSIGLAQIEQREPVKSKGEEERRNGKPNVLICISRGNSDAARG